MDRRFVAILAGLVIIFGAIFVISQNSSDQASNSGSSKSQPTNHVTGENQKNVILTEYGDYQCPVCGAYYQPLKEVVEKYSKDIRFQFRNLPLTSIHPNAFAAARAAEAAGLQGKYWEMHDKLYENQNSWSRSNDPVSQFKTYAQEVGLNITQFNSDYASGKVNDAINADLAAFAKTGRQQSTPSFFLNGKPIENSRFTDSKTGAPSLEKFSQVLDEEIAKK